MEVSSEQFCAHRHHLSGPGCVWAGGAELWDKSVTIVRRLSCDSIQNCVNQQSDVTQTPEGGN